MKNALKRSLSLLLAITIIFSSAYVGLSEVDFNGLFAVKANAASVNDFTFTLNEDGNSYFISGYSTSVVGEVVIPGMYNGLPVISIGENAFENCKNLTTVVIPDSITVIGCRAFAGCNSLKSIIIPDSVTHINDGAFGGCNNLSSVTLGTGVISIGKDAFSAHSSFSVYITDIVKFFDIDFANDSTTSMSLGENLYLNGELLTEIVIPDGVETISSCFFLGSKNLTSITIPDSVKTIETWAFKNCSNLTTVSFGNGVTSIGYGAFSGCTSLTSITIPDSVTSIGKDAFIGCSNLVTVTLGNSVESIGESAFCFCTKLTSISIPDSMKNIGAHAFYDCNNISSVHINDIASWCNISFGNINANPFFYGAKLYVNGEQLTEIVIPDGVKTIGDNAFFCCMNLKSVTIPSSVTSIGEGPFSGCAFIDRINVDENNSNYSSIDGVLFNKDQTTLIQYPQGKSDGVYTIPDGVTSIGGYAFWGCDNLESVIITDSVTNIAHYAFQAATLLSSITISNNVTNIGEEAFVDTDYYLNSNNWEDDILYIGNHLIKAKDLISSGKCDIKPGTKTIADNAFWGCDNLESVIIPDSVMHIGENAFKDCVIERAYLNDIGSWCNIVFGNDASNPLFCINELYIDGVLPTDVIIPDGVKAIPSRTFTNCTSLTSIVIPDSVKSSIGAQDFYGCTNLTTVEIGDGVTSIGKHAFDECPNLTTVTIGDGVTSIGKYAFHKCSNLTTVTIGDGVTTIDDMAFYGCKNLISATLPNNLKEIGESAFLGCVELNLSTIPSSVRSIAENAFYNCYSFSSLYISDIKAWCEIDFADQDANPMANARDIYIDGVLTTDIVIPDSVTSIRDYVFSNCANLTSVTIPDSVTSIGDSAFYFCSNLNSVTIPNSVTSIGQRAFCGCKSLTTITIPDAITSIGEKAFYYCTSLESINVETNNSEFLSVDGVLFNKDKTTLIQYPVGKTDTEYVIPSDVIKIDDSSFYNCEFLVSVLLPDGLVIIGDSAFENCKNLNSIVVPDSVKTIGEASFKNCENLTSVKLSANLKDISYSILEGCSNLVSIIIPNSVISIGESAFVNCINLKTILIPNSVTSIGDFAFMSAVRVESVFYSGTKEEWNQIALGGGISWIVNDEVELHFNVSAEEIDSHYNEVVVVPETCFEAGYEGLKCVCGYEKIIKKLYPSHKYSEWIIDEEATCTKEGSKHKECLRCGNIVTNSISTKNHSFSGWKIKQEPTCTEVGERYMDCTVCGEVLTTITSPCLGHDFETEWTIDIEPTCTTEGHKFHYCSRCDIKSDFTVINALGHTSSDWIVVKKVTCTTEGLWRKECTTCGEILETQIIEPEGSHDVSSWIIDEYATCTTNGLRHKECTLCGEILETAEIVATGHTTSEWIVDVEATCTMDGSKHTECYDCGEIIETTAISAYGHTTSEWIIDESATCSEEGSKHKECIECGDILETEVIPAKGHTSVKDPAVAATCTTAGKTEGSHCSVCNTVINAQTTVPAKGHTESEWIIDTQATASASGSQYKECTACGEVLENATIPQLKPATPKVTTTNEISGVNVTWNKVDGATKYNVYRRQGGYSTWTLVGSTTGNTLLDKNVKSGIYYVYSVRAYNNAGQYSDFASANTQTRKFMATPKLTTIYNHVNGLAIKWNAVAGVTNGYRVYRRGAGSTYWTYLGTTKNLYFIDSQVKNKSGEYFRYTVIADGGYHSKFDTTGLYLRRLANPTLTSAVSSTAGITVKWGAVNGTTGYYVYRKTANSTWTRVGTVGGTNNTTFLDKTAKKGTTYTYTVKAVYGATTSAYNSGISCYDKY